MTVYQILSDPDRYAGARCWSLDETVPRPGVGFIQPYPSRPDPSCGKPPGPWLHSFEHGGRYFRLRSVRAETERIERLRAEQRQQIIIQGSSTMTGAENEDAPYAFEAKEAKDGGQGPGTDTEAAEPDTADVGTAGTDGAEPVEPDDFDEDDPLHGLVERTRTDPDAPFEMEVLVALKMLRRDAPDKFARILRQLKGGRLRDNRSPQGPRRG